MPRIHHLSQASACEVGYKCDPEFHDFATCLDQNKKAHLLPTISGKKGVIAMSGSFKVLMVGTLGIFGTEREELHHKIARESPHATTLDVVTAIEIGFPLNGGVFDLKPGCRVLVETNHPMQSCYKDCLGTTLKPSLYNKVMVEMDSVLRKDVSVVTKGSEVRMKDPGHIYDGCLGKADESGDGAGMCKVSFYMPPPEENVVMQVSVKCLVVTKAAPDPMGVDGTSLFTKKVRMEFSNKYLIPTSFTGDTTLEKINNIQAVLARIDPLHIISPRVYANFSRSMHEWEDMQQVEAVHEVVSQKRERYLETSVNKPNFNYIKNISKNYSDELWSYLGHPKRLALFSVQERVGSSIASIVSGQDILLLQSRVKCMQFFRAVSVFWRGVVRMHLADFVHADAHGGNITVTAHRTGEGFSLKLIDFDRMWNISAHTVEKESYTAKEASRILGVLLRLVKHTLQQRCGSRATSECVADAVVAENIKNDVLSVLVNAYVLVEEYLESEKRTFFDVCKSDYGTWAGNIASALDDMLQKY